MFLDDKWEIKQYSNIVQRYIVVIIQLNPYKNESKNLLLQIMPDHYTVTDSLFVCWSGKT
jgi:hypothetical protein